jgi:hypothetical protein
VCARVLAFLVLAEEEGFLYQLAYQVQNHSMSTYGRESPKGPMLAQINAYTIANRYSTTSDTYALPSFDVDEEAKG